MRFDCALGYMQIVSDLRVVTALQKQLDNLLLPAPQLARVSFHAFHALHLTSCARLAVQWREQHQVRCATLFGSLSCPVHPRGQSPAQRLLKCKNTQYCFFPSKNRCFLVGIRAQTRRLAHPCRSFAQRLR